MRLLAIGDIHGCSQALDALLAQVAPTADDLIITLGDYVDRGPDSAGVIERLLQLRTSCQLVPLRGNHDYMMCQARAGIDLHMWLACGGKATLASYGVATPETCDLAGVPEAHWQFLDECLDWYETEKHFFVHGSVDPDLPLEAQDILVLHWEKLWGAPVAHVSGKTMVCGHTKQKKGVPLNLGTTVCIDTGVYEPEGWLTCLEVLTGHYWQANERGETRVDDLPEPA
jgi:serine/threonine protein phosphatase 1